ncbi:MAG: V-type ATPase 116kDa subunit family protein [bacterium]|jgi:V/A-type H+-transporting ATPase subunit I
MLVPERMKRMSIAILKQDMEPVLEEIAKAGVLHLTRIEEIDEWAADLESVGVGKLSTEYVKRQRRLRDLLEQVAPRAIAATGEDGGGGGDVGIVEISEIDRETAAIEKDLEPILEARRELTEKLASLKHFRVQVETIAPSGLPLTGLERSTLLASAVGAVDEKALPALSEKLSDIPSAVLPFNRSDASVDVVVIVLKRNRDIMNRALRDVGFKAIEVPDSLKHVSTDMVNKVNRDIERVEEELEEVGLNLDASSEEAVPRLLALLKKVEAAILLTRIKHYCKLTEKTAVFSGWVPGDGSDALAARIRERTGGKVVIEIADAESIRKVREGRVDVPVLLKNPSLLKPFQLLVSGYGMPSYNTVDPTLFVAITFLTMFGMMFGDVGHGLVLLVAGIAASLRSARFRDVGRLVAACGGSSIVFGFLYGSFFGLESLIPTIWVKPLEGITDLFKFSIGFGVVVVSLGIVLNIVNSLKAHSFVEDFFDKSGPLVGIIYWSGIGITVTFLMSSGGFPHPVVLFGLFVLPICLFFLKGPILKALGKRKAAFPEGPGTYVMEGVIEVLEILMGYLANTVSFIRVAAFGLAHAGLFVAVFSLAELVAEKPGGLVVSYIVLILGNILIILLEGLVVTIQAMRLEYYEFFSKFFRPAKAEYKPVFMGKFVGTDNVKGGG